MVDPQSAVPHEGVREGGHKRQKSLKKRTEEGWTTQEGGDERARRGDETARYLSKEAWQKPSPEEREATERKKREGSKKGEQYVENTEAAKKTRKGAAMPIAGYDGLNVEQAKNELQGLSNDELKKVRSYEKKHKNRKTLLQKLDRKIGYSS